MKIFLKDGRILTYNEAENVDIKNNIMMRILDEKGHWIAILNADLIERIDANPPCKIRRRNNKLCKLCIR